MNNIDLIKKAVSVCQEKSINDVKMGSVGCALETSNGNIFTGICIDTGSGMGFCAEHTAISSMLTDKEYKIIKIVAVWLDENNKVYVIPPCGRCREFIKQATESSLNTLVILDVDKTVSLSELLPYNDWWQAVQV